MIQGNFRHRVQLTRQWLNGRKREILLLAGLFLVGGLCFEAGLIRGAIRQSEPLVIRIPAVPEQASGILADPVATDTGASPVAAGIGAKDATSLCAFVGSKNSDKYHLPKCSFAKRIKPENRVCFASKEDAEKRGYVPGCVK